MKRVLLALVIALAMFSPVNAAVQARDSAGTTVTLLDTPCVNPVILANTPVLNRLLVTHGQRPVSAEALIAGKVFFRGKEYDACWVLVSGVIVVSSDDGPEGVSVFPVPVSDFSEPHAV